MLKFIIQDEFIDRNNNNNNNKNNNNRNNNNRNNNSLRYGFETKTSLDAFGDLLKERSQRFTVAPPPKDPDIWKRKPPDFTPRVYNPKPPKRNSREAIQPWKYVSASDEKMLERKTATAASDAEQCRLPQNQDRAPTGDAKAGGEVEGEGEKFVTRFKTVGSLDVKVLSVRHGTRRRSAYRMPKPHDFRGYPPIESLGLPEFATKYERDPYNLKFNKENPTSVLGSSLPQQVKYDPPSVLPPRTPQPHWDRNLILPKTQWPNKYAAYTRYRRWDRSAYSAKMERIEQQLTEQWKQEALERQTTKELTTNARQREL